MGKIIGQTGFFMQPTQEKEKSTFKPTLLHLYWHYVTPSQWRKGWVNTYMHLAYPIYISSHPT